MRVIRWLGLVVALALALGAPAGVSAQEAQNPADDKVVGVSGEDAEMNAAIAKARAGLSTFWTAKEKPAENVDGFALKVRIADGGLIEHFWLVDVAKDGDGYHGTINNMPNLVKSVKLGQRFRFAEDQISDWMFMRNGKIVGNETMRPLLKQLSPDEAERFRKLLETP